jgi:hypothetical protein
MVSDSNLNLTDENYIRLIQSNFTIHDAPFKISTSLGSSYIEGWPVLLLSLFVLIGAVGNLMVCIAIRVDPKLQNATNFYLLSLAATDLLICVFVIPLAIVKLFYSKQTIYSIIFGILWTVFLRFRALYDSCDSQYKFLHLVLGIKSSFFPLNHFEQPFSFSL